MNCSVNDSSRLIGKKWSVAVVEEIALGKFSSFNGFAKKSGVTPHILSALLKEFEKNNIIEKIIYMSNNRKTSRYILTDKGHGLHQVLREMKKWNRRWNNTPANCGKTACSECNLN